jgi:hypothetical protein
MTLRGQNECREKLGLGATDNGIGELAKHNGFVIGLVSLRSRLRKLMLDYAARKARIVRREI